MWSHNWIDVLVYLSTNNKSLLLFHNSYGLVACNVSFFMGKSRCITGMQIWGLLHSFRFLCINDAGLTSSSSSVQSLWLLNWKLTSTVYDFTRIELQLLLDNPNFVKVWMRWFATTTKTKKLKDSKAVGDYNEIMNFFMATAGCEAVRKVSIMAYQRKLENLHFEEIQVKKINNKRLKKII